MYGMVNIAIQEMVKNQYGTDKWEAVKTALGLEEDGFVMMQSYPDALTVSLIGKTAEVTGRAPAMLLEEIGYYWISYTAVAGYGELLDMLGDDLITFMKNVNSMHTRLIDNMPHMRVPTFEVEALSDRSMSVHYHSQRKGLEPMVVGLIKGAGHKFGHTCTVQMRESHPAEGVSQVFLVQW